MQCFLKIGSSLLLAAGVALVPAALPAASSAALAGIPVATINSPKAASKTAANAFDHLKDGDKTRADDYDLVLIKIPGASYVEPIEIDNRRIVSGVYADQAGRVHSFLWFNGQTVTIDKPDEPITSVGAITGNGLLFGNWGTDAEQHAGYYNLATATWTQFPDIPGYPINTGSRMNNSGHAVGSACLGTFSNSTNCDGWSWDGQDYTIYKFPGSIDTFPYGINNKGKEVGLWEKALNVYLGFTRFDDALEQLTLFTAAGEFFPTAYDINNDGAILAAAPLDGTDFWPSFILRGHSSVTRLPKYPGVLRTFYLGMNEREDLVGIWFNDPSGFPFYGLVGFHKERRD